MSGFFSKLKSYCEVFGPAGVVYSVRTRLASAPFEITTRPRGFDHPVHMRLKTTDLVTFRKIFIDREYGLELSNEPRWIIDAGANVGFASMFFARRYPGAKIVAIEPERENFALLQKNVRPYPNIIPMQAALWERTATLDLVDPGIGPWAFQVHEQGRAPTGKLVGTIAAVTVADLQKTHGMKTVDILKVDIEGGEKEVFDHSDGWLDSVGVVLIELHDRFKPGCTETFERRTRDFEFREQRGETIFKARRRQMILSSPTARTAATQ
jgi:FkbM family methyltransferase